MSPKWKYVKALSKVMVFPYISLIVLTSCYYDKSSEGAITILWPTFQPVALVTIISDLPA